MSGDWDDRRIVAAIVMGITFVGGILGIGLALYQIVT